MVAFTIDFCGVHIFDRGERPGTVDREGERDREQGKRVKNKSVLLRFKSYL